jgi:hypothetical protein
MGSDHHIRNSSNLKIQNVFQKYTQRYIIEVGL